VPLRTVTHFSSVNSSMAAAPPKRPRAAVLDAAERHLRLVVDRLVVDVDDARPEPVGKGQPWSGSLVRVPAASP
jgi:hypothetical protein